LIEAGILVRTTDGLRFNPASRQVDRTVNLLQRQLDLMVRLINEMIRDGIVAIE
jgi:hypothetical protein